MYRCFSIGSASPSAGIDPSGFECVVDDAWNGPMLFADMALIPVLPPTKHPATLDLGLAFVTPTSKQSEYVDGTIIAVDTNEWRICNDATNIMLLDIGIDGSHALVYAPAGAQRVLIRNGGVRISDTLDISDDGTPVINKRSRALLLLGALGYDPTKESKETTPTESKSTRQRKRSSRKATDTQNLKTQKRQQRA